MAAKYESEVMLFQDSQGEPLEENVVDLNSDDVHAVDKIDLNGVTSPTLQPSVAGYLTPLTPVSLEFPAVAPSMTPSIMMTDAFPKRQRTFSEFTRQSSCSFDLDADVAELQRLWEGLDAPDQVEKPSKAKTPKARTPRAESTPRSKAPKSVKTSSSKKRPAQLKAPSSVKQAKELRSSAAKSDAKKDLPSQLRSGLAASQVQAHPPPYSSSVRQQKIEAYMEKRKRRVWKKEIKYNCRKQFAESRPRIAGRFVPKSQRKSLDEETSLASSAIDLDEMVESMLPLTGI